MPPSVHLESSRVPHDNGLKCTWATNSDPGFTRTAAALSVSTVQQIGRSKVSMPGIYLF